MLASSFRRLGIACPSEGSKHRVHGIVEAAFSLRDAVVVAALGGFIGDEAKKFSAVALIHPELRIAPGIWREAYEIGSGDEMLLDVALLTLPFHIAASIKSDES
jgi:hypothetical protein